VLLSFVVQVCSEWLGSGVSQDVSDLKRVQQLLVSSLEKLKEKRQQTSLYGEAVATMEGLAVLKAWAEVSVCVAKRRAIIFLSRSSTTNLFGQNCYGKVLQVRIGSVVGLKMGWVFVQRCL